jgi:hypothetical protein
MMKFFKKLLIFGIRVCTRFFRKTIGSVRRIIAFIFNFCNLGMQKFLQTLIISHREKTVKKKKWKELKNVKKDKKGLKNGFCQNKTWDIKITKPFIKNRVGYVFYKCDTISKKKNFFLFLAKNERLWVLLYRHVKQGAKKA